MKQAKDVLQIALDSQDKPKLLKEWNPQQFKAIERKILSHFRKVGEIRTSSGHGVLWPIYNWNGVNNYLGLAYTSSSKCAGLWVCNVDAISEKYPIYRYVGFAIGENGKYYAILWDKDENEILQPL